MANAPLQIKKATVGSVDAVPTGYVGFIAGSDGKFYAKDGSSAAVEIGELDEAAVQDEIRIPIALDSTTYNADGTVNVVTRDDGWVFTHSYTNGLLSSIVQTKSGEPTTTITLTYNASEQLTSTTVVTA